MNIRKYNGCVNSCCISSFPILGGINTMTKNSYITMKNIKKSFNGVPVLKNVTLQIEKGEIHALLGENGAGKSTLMNILGGFISLIMALFT